MGLRNFTSNSNNPIAHQHMCGAEFYKTTLQDRLSQAVVWFAWLRWLRSVELCPIPHASALNQVFMLIQYQSAYVPAL